MISAGTTYLALVAVDKNGIIGRVHHNAKCGRHIALRNGNEGVLVWFDADLEVLNAVLHGEANVSVRIWLGNKGTNQC